MNKIKISLFFLLLIVFFGCKSTSSLDKLNISRAYNKEGKYIDLYYYVYHKNDSISNFYYSVNSSDFLYYKEFKNKTFTSDYIVKYELYSLGNSKIPADTFSFKFVDSVHYNKSIEIIDSFPLHVSPNKDFNLVLTIMDKNKEQKYSYLINVIKSNRNCSQNFIIRDENGSAVLRNFIKSTDKYYIFSNCENCKKLYVNFYKNDFSIAQPPHLQKDEPPISLKSDSNFVVELTDGRSIALNFIKKGIYHFRIDSTQNQGLTLFNYYDDFPEIESPERMLFPLKYITTKTEFYDLAQEKNVKSAIDNFWIEKAGNSDRAKEMIRKFYNRVKNANIFFSSYIEGWKTDRGMIYIVLGPPAYIYRSDNVETWIYGEENNILSLTFNFNKLENILSDNDYSLVRESGYRDSWYAAIETWRK